MAHINYGKNEEPNQQKQDGNPVQNFMQQDQETRLNTIYQMIGGFEDKSAQETRSVLKYVTSPKYGSSFVMTMLQAMTEIGCPVDLEKHVMIEECDPSSNLFGVFDQENNQIVLCKNKFREMLSNRGKQRAMEHLLSHELIHAFDHCRAKADFYTNPSHVMCSEIRAAALGGECMLKYNKVDSAFAGFSGYHQECVKKRALGSFMAVNKSWERKDAVELLNSIFPSCYNDKEPFDRQPLNYKDANLSYKAFLTRNRYTVF